MGKPLSVLIVEDDERDAELVLRELKNGDFDVTYERVQTRDTMMEALTNRVWNIVISDYSMPQFSALAALAVVKELKIDVPFIIVSGTVGEDIAVEALHAGAQDFMAKGRLARLIPAIDRELRDVAVRIERAKMQEHLLISDRMASVGILAAGVAHEINNPLAALMANLHFVAQDVAKLARDIHARDRATDEPVRDGNAWIASRLSEVDEPLQDAHDAAVRVRNIVKDLKVFSRADEEQTGPVDIRRVLESSLRMAWNEIRHRARLIKEYGNVPAVEGNEGRLGQVFLNLIVNAAQAIAEGSADQNEIRIVTSQDDRGRVVVEIRDTGSGISEDLLSGIFEPFVTTKAVGVGTGLGLAICHRIVSGIGGHITVESVVGKGTTFRTVLLPSADNAHDAAPVAESGPSARRAQILVVDDELTLATAVRRMLSAEHDVQVATSAREAIRKLSQGERFDMILSDLMMPQMSGMDLHAELVRMAPDQAERMVFMTGGAFTSRSRAFLDQVPNPRIEKPFDVGVLRALLNGLLRGR
jgi:signal transduction histidine kinase